MTFSSVAVLRASPRSRAKGLAGVAARDRWLEHRVWLIWGLLVLNVLTWTPGLSLIHIPSKIGQGITQGALVLALLLALTVNRKMTFRPNIFLCLMSLLALGAVLAALFATFSKSTAYRPVRYLEFVAVLWLLTPYWGRRDMLLVRCHLKMMVVVVATVVLGVLIDPGRALRNNLEGVIWPIPYTQLGHYAAVLLGIVVVLWFSGEVKTRTALMLGPAAAVILVLAHARTALVAGLGGILIAGLSLVSVFPRVRKFLAALLIIGVTAWLSLSAVLTSYLARGEGSAQLLDLSGRTKFWGPLLAFPRTLFQEIFGLGLTGGTFNGQPIDNNWLNAYNDQGYWAVTICALILVFLYLNASFAPRGPQRALALFLITYCLIASFLEDGFTQPTTYSLDLMLAASLLVPFGMVRGTDAD